MLKRVPQDVTSGQGWQWNASAGRVDLVGTPAVMDSLDINGPVYANSDRLVMTKSRVRCTNENNWCLFNMAAYSTVTDTEVGGGSNGTTFVHAISANVYGPGVVFTRVNIHHMIQGLRADAGITVRDSWFHDFVMGDATASGSTNDHSEGSFTTGCHPAWAGGVCGAILFDHDAFSSGNTACIFVQVDGDPSANAYIGTITVQNSRFYAYLHNGENSSFGFDAENKGITANTHITLTGNVFDKTGWGNGPVQTPLAATVSSGNVYTDGTPVPIWES